jgi:hypothetical protein
MVWKLDLPRYFMFFLVAQENGDKIAYDEDRSRFMPADIITPGLRSMLGRSISQQISHFLGTVY